MKSLVRKLVAGTLLCSMTLTQAPVWNMPAVQVKAQEVKNNDLLHVRLVCKSAYLLSLKNGWNVSDCTFKSENKNIAQVSKEGVIFGVSAGCTDVTVTYRTGESVVYRVEVYGDDSYLADEKIFLMGILDLHFNYQYENLQSKELQDCSSVLVLNGEEDSRQLVPFVMDSKYTGEDITYTVADESIICVKNDTVYAKAPGKTVLTLSLPNGEKKEINVEVNAMEKETKGVKLNCKSAFLLSLKDGWDAKDCTFKSENENIVQVSKEGVIFGVSSGSANVIVTHKSGESFSCKVDVFGDCGFVIDKEKISETATIAGVAHCDRECIPGGLKEAYIPEYAYNGTTENCAFEVIRIRKHAFKGQSNLEKVVIPKTMQIIQEESFKDCEALKTVVFLSKNVEIAENAFDNTQITFLGYKGSSAEEYAAAHDNITFQEISEDEEMPKLKEEILLARIYEYVKEDKVIKAASDIDSTLFLNGEGAKVDLIPFITGSKYTREDITYTVKDENIVSVENETVHAKAAGKTVVTLSLPNGVTRDLNVTVEGEKKQEGTSKPTETPKPKEEASKKSKSISLTWKAKKQTMKVGKTYTFKVKVKNSNKPVKWSVSNKKIAVIQANTGKLKAKKAGKVKVTAKCNGVKKTCVVTIKK